MHKRIFIGVALVAFGLIVYFFGSMVEVIMSIQEHMMEVNCPVTRAATITTKADLGNFVGSRRTIEIRCDYLKAGVPIPDEYDVNKPISGYGDTYAEFRYFDEDASANHAITVGDTFTCIAAWKTQESVIAPFFNKTWGSHLKTCKPPQKK